MKRLLTAAVIALSLVVLAPPALATQVSEWDYYYTDGFHHMADTWSNSGTEHYCVDPAYYDLGPNPALNIEDSINDARFPWTADTQFNRGFVSDGECAGQASFVNAVHDAKITKGLFEEWQEEFCANYLTGSASRVEYENIGGEFGNAQAVTIVCDRDNNGTIDFFVVLVDVAISFYHWPCTNPTAEYPMSFCALMAHEWGHVTGWFNQNRMHFLDNGDGVCPNNGNHNTMCNDGWGDSYNNGGLANLTLQNDDIAEVNQAY